MHKFEKLTARNKSLQLVRTIYSICNSLPYNEEKNLIDPIKRSSTSICLNIAEGCGAENDKEFKRFLMIAKKSAFEVVATLRIIYFLYKIPTMKAEADATEVLKLLNGLIKYLKSND